MIGTQPTGAIAGVVISAVAHEGLSVTVDGKPARLAIIDDEGNVITASPLVAREVEAVALNSHRNFWAGQGHLRVMSRPLDVNGVDGLAGGGKAPTAPCHGEAKA